MIIQHDPNCNPDDFIYKTNFTWGQDVGKEIMDQVNKDLDYFQRRIKYTDATSKNNVQALVRKIGAKRTRELIRRQDQIEQHWPGEKFISFKQYWCGEHFDRRIMECLPDWVNSIAPNEPVPILQVSTAEEGQGLLPPHCGHQRISSLFCLVQGGGQETRWYNETEPFEVIDIFHIPDMDKIKLAVSVVLEPNVWYVFNHRAWHSVHKFAYQGPPRVNFGVDFDSISAPDLVKLCKQHGG